MQQKSAYLLFAILIAAASAAVFAYPSGFGAQALPWRLGLDIVGGTRLTYSIDLSAVSAGDKSSVISGLRDVMEKRANLFGVSEPHVTATKSGGIDQLVVELAGIKDVNQAVDSMGKTAFLEFKELSFYASSSVSLYAQEDFVPTGLTGKYLKSAQPSADNLGRPEVALNFTEEGASLFAAITGRNVGKPLAIFLDNQLISSPRVNEQITGGSAVITGVAIEEARTLSNLLNAGALPAPITLVSESTIGASLGSSFLKNAIIAGAVGTAAVMIFMAAYYRVFGIFSALALLLYSIFTLAVFKSVGVTMSLAGIAGFILSIGMAVDANILIFERTKEELKKGLSRPSAIEEGFHRAWPSIRDSNISTMITAVILYASFSGTFVQGFALTLLIGVAASMFSAITVTRTFLRVFMGS